MSPKYADFFIMRDRNYVTLHKSYEGILLVTALHKASDHLQKHLSYVWDHEHQTSNWAL